MDKLLKLKQLKGLLDDGLITQEEFSKLKSEVINNKSVSDHQTVDATAKDENKTNFSSDTNQRDREKIILNSFEDCEGKKIVHPEIEYLNFKNITKEELGILKPFLRLKQIHAPSEMSKDEITIIEKVFSPLEIATMNSERAGFNHAFPTILSVLCACAALFFIKIAPCMIIFGAGSGLISSIFISIFILNKADATKLDRNFSYIALAISVFAIILYFK